MSKGARGTKTALITGASSGFGVEFARLFARDGYNVVLVARGEDKLRALAAEVEGKYKVRATVLAKDLALPDAPAEIAAELTAAGIRVDALVNNAGFATYGPFTEVSMDEDLNMLKVNILALTALTKLFLPEMVKRKSGAVLNVASTAAFQPGPLMSGYYASKAYVLHFTEAIAEEVRGSGVTISCLCPGPSATGFQQRAAMEKSKLVNGRQIMDAKTVAVIGYKGLLAGKRVVIPGLMNRLMALTPRLAPRALATRFVMRLQEQVGH